MVYSRGVVVWDDSVLLTGFFRWVLSWRVGSGFDRGLASCVCLRSFCGEGVVNKVGEQGV